MTITVNPVNDAPVAVNDSYTHQRGHRARRRTAGVLGNDSDADGDPLTAVAGHRPGPRHARPSTPTASFTYTPDRQLQRPRQLHLHGQRRHASNSNVATVSITVNPVNDAPVGGQRHLHHRRRHHADRRRSRRARQRHRRRRPAVVQSLRAPRLHMAHSNCSRAAVSPTRRRPTTTDLIPSPTECPTAS